MRSRQFVPGRSPFPMAERGAGRAAGGERARLASGWLLLASLLATPLAARPLQLTVAPQPATWHEPISLTVRGLGCSPTLGPFRVLPTAPLTVEGSLLEACASGEAPAPFELTAPLEVPAPGPFTVRVRDADATSTSLALTAYELGTAVLELPPVVQAGEPVTAILHVRAGCGFLDAEVEGRVVEIRFDSGCVFPVLPPPIQVHRVEIPLGALEEGRYEVHVFDGTSGGTMPGLLRRSLLVVRPGSCVPDGTTLCLHGSRFRVDGTWRDFSGRTGRLHAAPLPGNEESGLAWFFDPGNVELTIKILDACAVNERYWVFVSSGSTVEYTLTVTDTRTGRARTYANPLGRKPPLVADVTALESCS